MADLGSMVVRILGDISDFDKKLGAAEDKMKKTAENLTKMGKSMTTFVSLPLIGIAAAATKAAMTMEDAEAAFTTMLGSASKAKALLEDMRKFAAATPFKLTDLTAASKTLMQFGVEASKIMPTLKQIGDVSGGNAQRFQALSLAFGQTTAAGRLMGQDLLQMVNAGFNPLQEISKTTGQSMIDLKKQMEAGSISADMVAQSFARASGAGGQFFGGMERGSKTLSGQLSTLLDELSQLGREFGEVFLPVAKDAVKGLTDMVKGFQGMTTTSKETIITVGAIVAAIGPLILLVSGLTKAVTGLKIAMAFLSGNLVVAGLLAAAAAAAVVYGAFQKTKIEIEKTNEAEKKYAEDAVKYSDTRVRVQKEEAKLEYEDSQARRKRLEDELKILKQIADAKAKPKTFTDEENAKAQAMRDQLQVEFVLGTRMEDRIKLLELEKKAIIDRANAANVVTGEEIDAINAAYELKKRLIEAEYELQEVQEDGIETSREIARTKAELEDAAGKHSDVLTTEQLAREQRSTGKRKQYLGDYFDAATALNQEMAENNAANDSEVLRDEQKSLTDSLGNVKQYYQNVNGLDAESLEKRKAGLKAFGSYMFSQTQAIANQLFSLSQTLTNNQIADIDRKTDASLQANEDEKNAMLAKVGDAADAAAQKEKIEADYAAKEKEIKKKAAQDRYKLELAAFESKKAFDTASAVVSTASMAIEAFKALVGVPVIGPALAAAAAVGALALGATQIANIQSQQAPSPPALAQGGIVMPRAGGVLAQVAEAGQPEVVFPLDKLERFLSTGSVDGGGSTEGGDIHLTVNLDSKPFLDKIFPATRNRQILISAGAVV